MGSNFSFLRVCCGRDTLDDPAEPFTAEGEEYDPGYDMSEYLDYLPPEHGYSQRPSCDSM